MKLGKDRTNLLHFRVKTCIQLIIHCSGAGKLIDYIEPRRVSGIGKQTIQEKR